MPQHHSAAKSQPEPAALPDEIERLALLGWALFPTYPKSRTTPKGAKDAATCDLERLEAWQASIPGCGWKVHLGKSKLWALDVDVPSENHAADGRAVLRGLLDQPGQDLPRTPEGKPDLPMLRSGGGGWCMIFTHESGESIQGHPRPDMLGLDPLRGEQAITVPPSLHRTTGIAYRWINPPWTCHPKRAPRWLTRLYEPPPPPATPRPRREASSELAERWLMDAVMRVQSAGDGQRNTVLNRNAFRMGQAVVDGLIGENYARASLYDAAMSIGLEARESVATIDGAFKRARTVPRRAR